MSRTTSARQIIAANPTAELGQLPDEYWEIIERYRGELVNQAFAILGSLQDSEDVVQDSFCEVFRETKKLTEAHSIGAWLRRVNKANALNRLRGRKRDGDKNSRSQQQAPRRQVTTGGFSHVELRESVAQVVEQLPERERSVIVMRYWDHMSYGEIAQRIGLPEGTVGRLIYEATQHLYAGLTPHLESPSSNVSDNATGEEIT